jgi:hypothetical protein
MNLGQKQIQFPTVKTIRELFEVLPKTSTLTGIRMNRPSPGNMIIGTYCGVRGLGNIYSLKVRPTQMVLDFINADMISVEYDELSFEIVMRTGGEALVVVSHSKIIGSRWLALIPHSEVPKET